MTPQVVRRRIMRAAGTASRRSNRASATPAQGHRPVRAVPYRRSEREYLHINPRRIHLRDSSIINVAELFQEFFGGRSKLQGVCLKVSSRAIEEPWTCVVFFKSYGSHPILELRRERNPS